MQGNVCTRRGFVFSCGVYVGHMDFLGLIWPFLFLEYGVVSSNLTRMKKGLVKNENVRAEFLYRTNRSI